MAVVSVYLFILLFINLQSSNAQQCYFPDGSLASGHRPCNLNATHSACCSTDNPQGADYCLSSGLCWGRGYGFTWRNSCTDKSWKDSACPTYCANANRNTYVGVLSCDSWNNGRWCCQTGQGTCCNDTTALFMAATGIGDIVSDLNLPKDVQTVIVHSTTSEIIIGIVIGIPALMSIGLLTYALRRERKARTKETRGLQQALELAVPERQDYRPELDAWPRAVEVPSIPAHNSFIGLETAARQRDQNGRKWRKQRWTDMIAAAARPHRPNLSRPSSSPEFRTSIKETDPNRPATS